MHWGGLESNTKTSPEIPPSSTRAVNFTVYEDDTLGTFERTAAAAGIEKSVAAEAPVNRNSGAAAYGDAFFHAVSGAAADFFLAAAAMLLVLLAAIWILVSRGKAIRQRRLPSPCATSLILWV